MTYTAKQIFEMTPEQIRKAIALSLGWTEAGTFVIPPMYDKRMTWAAEWDENGCPHWMEHWESEISEAYALEETVLDENKGIYIDFLTRVILKDLGLWVSNYELAHATPLRRCKAYLMMVEARENIYFEANL